MKHKSWLSPLLFMLFAALTVTGLLLMFHMGFPGIKGIHEWGGIVFAIIGIFHLVLNRRMFTRYFQNKNTIIGVVSGVVIILVAMLISPQGKGDGYGKNKGYAGYSGYHHNGGRR